MAFFTYIYGVSHACAEQSSVDPKILVPRKTRALLDELLFLSGVSS